MLWSIVLTFILRTNTNKGEMRGRSTAQRATRVRATAKMTIASGYKMGYRHLLGHLPPLVWMAFQSGLFL